MNSSKKNGEWIIVHPTDVMTMLPVYQCSLCKGLVDGYDPDKICLHCGSENKKAVNKYIKLAIGELNSG